MVNIDQFTKFFLRAGKPDEVSYRAQIEMLNSPSITTAMP
jgi:hypothetical protein